MIHFVHTFGILFVLFIFGFCLVSGVLRAGQLFEEYPVRAKKLLKWSGISIVVAHFSLWLIDGFPWFPSLCGVLCQAVFASNLKDFPLTDVHSVRFIASLIACLINHFVWLFYFLDPNSYHHLSTAAEMILFILVIVWFVPLLYLLALSDSSLDLPTSTKNEKPRRPTLFNSIVQKFSSQTNNSSVSSKFE